MKDYRVMLMESDDGFSVSCPELRGCHSQGATREEALGNIRIAIQEWLDAEIDERESFRLSEEIIQL